MADNNNSTSLYNYTSNNTVSKNDFTTLYNTTPGNIITANVTDTNFTTLYSAQNIINPIPGPGPTPNYNYGNSNVESFLNTGNDVYGNQVQNIIMHGDLHVGNKSYLGNVGNVNITGGSANYVLQTDGLGNLSWGISGGIPAGSNTYIQYNNDGNFGASANFTFDSSTNTLTVANIVGNISNAINVTGNSQPNITSVGTLNDITVTGNANFNSASNVILGEVYNVKIFGGDSYTNKFLTVSPTGNGNLYWSSGPSNVDYANSAGQLLHTERAGGVSTLYWSDIDDPSNKDLLVLSANYGWTATLVSGAQDGNLLLGSNYSYGITPTLWTFTKYGNFVLPGNTFAVNYANGTRVDINNVASANFSNFAGNVTVSSQPNITSIGTLATLNVRGNVSSANYILGNGAFLTGLPNGNYATNANFANYAGNVTVSSQPNITSVGTLATLNVTGNISSANYILGNGAFLTGLPNGNYATNSNFANFAGNVVNANQSNITSLGTLSNLTSNGTINFSNATNVSLGAVGNLHITGGNANYLLQTDGNGNLSWTTISSGTLYIHFDVASSGNNQTFTYAGLSAYANNYTMNVMKNGVNIEPTLYAKTGNTTLQININLNAGDSIDVLASNSGGSGGGGGNANPGGSNSQVQFNSAGSFGGSANFIWNNSTNALSVIGNITSNNASLGNVVIANYYFGSGNNLSNIQGSNVSGAVAYATTANSVAGSNVSGQVGNALIAGTVYTNAQPNITSTGTLISLSVTGNISAGNISSAGTGNVSNVLFTKFSETVVSGGSVSGTLTPNATAGTIYEYTLTGNITLSTLSNAVAGTSMTIVLTQDGTGNRTLTSTMKFQGGNKTLSTAASTTDIMFVFYDGTNYYATLTKGYV